MARNQYITIAHEATARLEERKSLFLAFCKPVTTEQEADDFLKNLRLRYPDAGHHVYAWILGGSDGHHLQRYSDDGEPSGTAGAPIMESIIRQGLSDLIVVVVRYFGGTLLGTGGLVKSYSESAMAAVDAAGVERMIPSVNYSVEVDYKYAESLRRALTAVQQREVAADYAEHITMTFQVSECAVEMFLAQCRDSSLGTAFIERLDVGFMPLPRQHKGQ